MNASAAEGNSGAGGPPSKVVATRNKQTNFSAYEDNLLCKSWLEISCDPVINTGQKRLSFWVRVVERYNSQRSVSGEDTKINYEPLGPYQNRSEQILRIHV